jgi:hypothetical protein
MPVDRQKFLMLVLGLGVGRVASGCVVVESPPPDDGTRQADQTAGGDTAAYEPGAECVSWDATGECVQYAYDQTAPADECVGWDPSGECIQWASDSTAPTDECVNWDPSGECIGWASDGGYAPTQECVSWDPSGECVGWQPAYES